MFCAMVLKVVSFSYQPAFSLRLSTPPITMPATLPICVRFDYFMGGSKVGRLTVYDSRREGEDRMFDKRGHQGNNWNLAQETLQAFRNGSKVHSCFIKRGYF